MKTRSFTILEILVVVGIIFILIAILVPATSTILRRAKISKTEAAIRNLQIAIKQYEALYGFLPMTGTNADEHFNLNAARLRLFYEALCKSNNLGANPRQVQFLDCNFNNAGDPVYKDAWEEDFRISLDLDYDGEVADGVVNGYVNPGTGDALRTSTAIWSVGPDGTDSILDSDPSNYDNVSSWD